MGGAAVSIAGPPQPTPMEPLTPDQIQRAWIAQALGVTVEQVERRDAETVLARIRARRDRIGEKYRKGVYYGA